MCRETASFPGSRACLGSIREASLELPRACPQEFINTLLFISSDYPRMTQDRETASSVAEGRSTPAVRVFEVLGVLGAVIPCGILAGFYMASKDPSFLIACFVFAALAVGVVLWRTPRRSIIRARSSGLDRQDGARSRASWFGDLRLPEIGAGRNIGKKISIAAGFGAWVAAWCFLALMFAGVAQDTPVWRLALLVLLGAFSPVILYVLLEGGAKRIMRHGSRVRHRR